MAESRVSEVLYKLDQLLVVRIRYPIVKILEVKSKKGLGEFMCTSTTLRSDPLAPDVKDYVVHWHWRGKKILD
jgi:hypothetical protein